MGTSRFDRERSPSRACIVASWGRGESESRTGSRTNARKCGHKHDNLLCTSFAFALIAAAWTRMKQQCHRDVCSRKCNTEVAQRGIRRSVSECPGLPGRLRPPPLESETVCCKASLQGQHSVLRAALAVMLSVEQSDEHSAACLSEASLELLSAVASPASRHKGLNGSGTHAQSRRHNQATTHCTLTVILHCLILKLVSGARIQGNSSYTG